MSGSAYHSPSTGRCPARKSFRATSIIASTFASIFAGSSPVPERYGPATRMCSGRLMSTVSSPRNFFLRSPSSASSVRQMARERFQHGHAHGDAHLNLLADERLGPIGDLGGDLDAAVHRAGMHHERVGPRMRELVLVETEEAEILLHARHEGAVHALALQAQHHDDVGA